MIPSLTKSENEVIRLKALGYYEKEIADIRCTSIHTVKALVKRAIKKTKAKSSYEVVARFAITCPNLFKYAVVALFMSIQAYMIQTEFNEDLRRPNTQKTVRRGARRSRKLLV
jgi:DNA-binding CsgD family transcriptional regulator